MSLGGCVYNRIIRKNERLISLTIEFPDQTITIEDLFDAQRILVEALQSIGDEIQHKAVSVYPEDPNHDCTAL